MGCAPTLPPPSHTASAPLVEPWSAMVLPLDGATVRHSDVDTLTAAHPAGSVIQLADRYVDALVASGAVAGRRVDADRVVQQDFTLGDRALSLALRVEGDSLVASLAWVPN